VWGTWAKRLGGDPTKQQPADWDRIDPKTGEPVGIDKGWGYAPGKSVANEVSKMAAKTRQWQYTLAKAYMRDVPASRRDSLARSYRALPSVADDVRRYAQSVLANRPNVGIQPYKTMGLLTGSDAAKVKALTGKDVELYDYALDPSSVGHIKRKHGGAAGEFSRGQRPVATKDYAALPRILNSPDLVEDGGISDVGQPVVRYSKKIGGELYTTAFEVRKKRKMLALQSMWIKRP